MSLITIDHVTRLFPDTQRGQAITALDDVSYTSSATTFYACSAPVAAENQHC